MAFETLRSRMSSTCVNKSKEPFSHALRMNCCLATFGVVINDLICHRQISAAQVATIEMLGLEHEFIEVYGVAERVGC